MKLTSIKTNPTHRVLVYGEPKTGKTELVGKLAAHKKIIYCGLENGHATLLKLPEECLENIEALIIPDSRVFPIAIETMLKLITGARMSVCHEHGKVNCPAAPCKAPDAFTSVCFNELDSDTVVVVDSLSQLTTSAMSHITKGKPDDYKPDWEDYRMQGALLDKFLSQVQQASFNIVCVTHVVETELDNKQKKLVPLCGTTSFSRNTAKYFDHVIYCQIKNGKHDFASMTGANNLVLTGSRTDFDIAKSPEQQLIDLFTTVPQARSVAAGALSMAAKLGGLKK